MKIIRICLYRFLLIFIASVPVNLCAAGEMQKYSDEKNKISFSYPSGWKQMTPAEAKSLGAITGKYLTVIIYDPKDWTQNVNVQILYPVAAQDLTEAGYKKFQKRFDRNPSKMPGFRKISAKVGKRSDMELTRFGGHLMIWG